MHLPDQVEEIIHTLEQAGHEAYAVGGCVRDALLGLTPDDWDITTSAEPIEVKALFARTFDTGIKHGTVTVVLHGKSFEVTTYRIDGSYEDGRHPEEVTYTKSLEEDLRRRDFTINAMAYNDHTGIVDCFGGQQDLDERIIRCVGDPIERFSEDALRMMRAVRFAARLDFSIEEETLTAITKLKENLSKVSAERISAELLKLITSDHPEQMRTLCQTGLSRVFFPEWDQAMACQQNTKHHCYTVGEHTIEVMRGVRPDKVMRLSALLHDIGKPVVKRTDKKGQDHFQGHPELSAEMAEQILRRLKSDNDTIKRVTELVRYHDERPVLNQRSIRRCMRDMDTDFADLFELKRADIGAQSDFMREEKLQEVEEFERLYQENLDQGCCTDKSHLAITGVDLIEAGVEKGPVMGKVMEKLLDDVIEEPGDNTKETLLKKAARYSALAKKGSLLLSLCAFLVCLSLTLTSCTQAGGTVSYRAPGIPLSQASGDAWEDSTGSLDQVYIIEETDTEQGRFTVMNVTSLREFRYPYDVSTEFLDKYGDRASVEDFEPGMAITIDATGRYGLLTQVQISDAVWEWDGLSNFSFDQSLNLMKLGNENYKYTASTLFLDGNDFMDYSDLVPGVDRIRVTGVGKQVLAVALEKGHGYLQLSATSRFDDSLIQIGSYDASLVSSDKIFTLPAGSYEVTIANKGWGGTKKVKIKKNVTSVLNLESMKGDGPKTCKLTFEIDVDGAKIYLDGSRVEPDETMDVLYGSHSLMVTAEGYDDWDRTLYVNSEEATISLDISDSKQGTSGSSSTDRASGTDTNGSTVTTGNGTSSSEPDTTTSSSGATQSNRDKASEDYLSTLADSIVSAIGSTLRD